METEVVLDRYGTLTVHATKLHEVVATQLFEITARTPMYLDATVVCYNQVLLRIC